MNETELRDAIATVLRRTGGEVDSLNADGSLDVWYPLEQKLEDVPVAEVRDGNVPVTIEEPLEDPAGE